MPYRVENIVRKGEIACYKQFLFFSQCFPSYISLVRQNAVLCGNGFTLFQTTNFLDVAILKVFADNKLYLAKMTIFLFDRAENTVRKGENAGYQHFPLFPQCFPKLSNLASLKVGIVW